MLGHRARKRFGQNFLADAHYVERIVEAVAPRPGDNLVEIGPGLGALTNHLIEHAARITAIEIDRDLAARLRATCGPDQLVLHEADALAFDYAILGRELRVVGN
ncbi:MAG TPA: rRNA adenine N-6-methyltransferase family protein, partial [Casimicrobiaceae bacterium]|nr:rRNA adenine N-6-methyltransferase family protein [Casimicrobiaceae bacterium]